MLFYLIFKAISETSDDKLKKPKEPSESKNDKSQPNLKKVKENVPSTDKLEYNASRVDTNDHIPETQARDKEPSVIQELPMDSSAIKDLPALEKEPSASEDESNLDEISDPNKNVSISIQF